MLVRDQAWLLRPMLLACVLGVSREEAYLNQWVMEVHGGPGEARALAERHGFTYRGQVGTLENFYIMEHPSIMKRSATASDLHSAISAEPQVRWVQQQVSRRRVKRDVAAPASSWDPHLNDEKWKDMWYLHGGAHGGFDMNVKGAWRKGYTGRGIVVTILDDGIERTHTDLSDNYDPDASWDINGNDDDPLPRYDHTDENRHGTRCAGEVAAAANNTKCVPGVAYKARIGGVRMLDGDVSDLVEATSLSLNPQHIDIYSASWGPDDDGRVVDGPAKLAKHAFIQGVLKGRGGKGSIYVWASGNGGNADDSCNCDGYTNSIFTLSISSSTEWGKKPWYLEECSSTLATTYSSGDNMRDRKIVTVDLHNRCTSSHTGTSASAPLAAGLCALALEANPELGWRDMQYIVMMTAKTEPLQDGNWITNGVGRRVSHRYGYGLMDAGAMVELAEKWQNVPEQHICLSETLSVQKDIRNKGLQVDVTTDGCVKQSDSNIRYLEHVQAKVTLEYSRRGDLQIYLRSPSGTRSMLLPKRKRDYINAGFNEWPFMSTHFWGENPKGRWILEIENVGSDLNHGVLKKWQLILYGVATNPVNLRNGQQIYGLNTSTAISSDYVCSPECTWRCTGPNPKDCIECKNFRHGPTGPCVASCPDGYYGDHRTRVCRRCHSSCETCTGRRAADCMTCHTGSFLIEQQGVCADHCPPHHYIDGGKVCRQCSSLCKTCSGDATQCTTCELGLQLVNGRCTTDCPEKHFKDGSNKCVLCHDSCLACVGASASQCISCQGNQLYQEGWCVAQCKAGFFQIQTVGRKECHRCPETCENCFDAQHCTVCKANHMLVTTGHCLPKMANGCPAGHFKGQTGQCEACDSSCEACRGATQYDCLSCPLDRYLNGGECVADCTDGFYKSTNQHQQKECLPCHHTCRRCGGKGASECTACLRDFKLVNGRCQSPCNAGQYQNPSGVCSPCDASCAECSGPLSSECLSCGRGQLLLNNACVHSVGCPLHHYQLDGMCRHCHMSCYTCSGDSPNNCLSCPEHSALEGGACFVHVACTNHQYYDISQERCEACHSSCSSSCHGPLATDCGLLPAVQIAGKQTPVSQLLGNLRSTAGSITLFIAFCIILFLVGFSVYGVIYLRSNKKCCWKNDYTRVPAVYQNGLDTVHLMVGDLEEEDDDMDTVSEKNEHRCNGLTSTKLSPEDEIYSTKVIANGR